MARSAAVITISKRFLLAVMILTVTALVLTLVGITHAGSPSRILRAGTLQFQMHPIAKTFDYFADRVFNLTNGDLKISVHYARSLGDAREVVEYIRLGTVDFAHVPTANLTQILPTFDVFSLPFIFKNTRHYWAFLHSEKAQKLLEPLNAKGITPLFWVETGVRSFFTRGKPIRHPDDMKGMKIRVMASPIMVGTINALGGNGVALAASELYGALQTGVVDGAEMAPNMYYSYRYYEVTDFFAESEHFMTPDVMLMSKKTWDSLSKGQKEAILKASAEAESYLRGADSAFLEFAVSEIKKMNKFVTVDKAPFQKAVAAFVAEQAKKLGAEDIVADIQKIGEQY